MSTNKDRLSIHEILSNARDRNPSATALLEIGRTGVDFQTLLEAIEETGLHLRKFGVGPKDRVALVLPGGASLAVALLSTASYAQASPLNPAYKLNEFKAYFADLHIRAAILPAHVDSPARSAAQELGLTIIDLDEANSETAGLFDLSSKRSPVETSRPSANNEEDIAIVMHTSGTTSRPKKVPLTHRNIGVSALNTAKSLGLAADDRSLCLLPLFHIHGFVGALLSQLAAGGSVVCTPGFVGPKFFEWLDATSPTWFTAVPTIYQAILARAPSDSKAPANRILRFLRSASAPLPIPVIQALECEFGCPVIETYGMTEASPLITCNPMPPGRRKPGSVGIAFGTEIKTVDGELVVRGANVMSGYEDDHAANDAAFLPGGWLRTGDLATVDPEGYVFITGRAKEMINRAGEKVSPFEVESILAQHPAVAQAAVFAVPDPSVGEEVAAAVVLKKDASADDGEILDFAAGFLADHKIPRRLLIVDAIPMGTTGKVQRLGLAKALGLAGILDGKMPAPAQLKYSDDTLRSVTRIWREELRVTAVRESDSFFDLGGDSILVAAVVGRISEALEINLSFRSLYENRTLAQLADKVESLRALGRCKSRIEIVDRSRTLPVSPHQERWVTIHRNFPTRSNITLTQCRLRGPIRVDLLRQALQLLIDRHEIFRVRFDFSEGVRQILEPRLAVRLEEQDLLGLSETDRSRRLAEIMDAELKRETDLTTAPLWHFQIVHLKPDDRLFLMNIHHTITDYWSKGIFLEELMSAYHALIDGQVPRLPANDLQYLDFAAWLRQSTDKPDDEKIEFWRERLRGTPTRHFAYPIPTTKERSGDARVHYWSLEVDVVSKLKKYCASQRISLFSVIQTVFAFIWMKRAAGSEDFIFGILSASSRERRDVSRLLGPCATVVPIRFAVQPSLPFGENARALHTINMLAIENSLPQSLLVEKLGATANPDVTLNMMNVPTSSTLHAGDLKLEWLFERPFDLLPSTPLELGIAFRELGAGDMKSSIIYRLDRFPKSDFAAGLAADLKSALTFIAHDSEYAFAIPFQKCPR